MDMNISNVYLCNINLHFLVVNFSSVKLEVGNLRNIISESTSTVTRSVSNHYHITYYQ